MPRRTVAWMVFAVTGLAVVGGVHLAVAQVTRGRPNYDQVGPHRYLGAYVRTPPPGTEAVLNLCETEDRYTFKHHRWQPIPDAGPAPTLDWLRKLVAFVREHQRAGRTTYCVLQTKYWGPIATQTRSARTYCIKRRKFLCLRNV